MNVEHHLPLAPRDLLILAVLAEGPLHGYGIIKAVETRSESGVLLDPANLYRVLRRMRRLAWIRETDDAGVVAETASGEGGSGGPGSSGPDSRRRVYSVTSEGRTLLVAELARLERLLQQVRPAVSGGT